MSSHGKRFGLFLSASILATVPSASQAQYIIQDDSNSPPAFDKPPIRREAGCIFVQTNPFSPLARAAVVTDRKTLYGVKFQPGDVYYTFGEKAEFLVRGHEITTLPDTPPSATETYADTVNQFVDLARGSKEKKGLIERCTGIAPGF